MKRLECSVARALGLFLVITSLWGVAANAAHYTIIELGKLPGGSYPVEGYAINNAGQVSGLALASDER